MEEKEREHARAKAARADYAKDAEEAQAWLQAAEARTQDRAGPRPHDARARLQEVSLEAGAAAERLERLSRVGQTLAEKTSSQQERELVTSTCSSLTDQLGHLRHLLEQRKMAVSQKTPGLKVKVVQYKQQNLKIYYQRKGDIINYHA